MLAAVIVEQEGQDSDEETDTNIVRAAAKEERQKEEVKKMKMQGLEAHTKVAIRSNKAMGSVGIGLSGLQSKAASLKKKAQ